MRGILIMNEASGAVNVDGILDDIRRMKEVNDSFEYEAAVLDLSVADLSGKGVSAEDAARIFAALDDLGKTWRESVKVLSKLENILAYSVLPNAFGDVKSIQIDGVGRVSIEARYSCTMIDERGMAWLKENGYDGLVKETVNSRSLSAEARKCLEDTGEEFPPEMFKTTMTQYANVRKAK